MLLFVPNGRRPLPDVELLKIATRRFRDIAFRVFGDQVVEVVSCALNIPTTRARQRLFHPCHWLIRIDRKGVGQRFVCGVELLLLPVQHGFQRIGVGGEIIQSQGCSDLRLCLG